MFISVEKKLFKKLLDFAISHPKHLVALLRISDDKLNVPKMSCFKPC